MTLGLPTSDSTAATTSTRRTWMRRPLRHPVHQRLCDSSLLQPVAGHAPNHAPQEYLDRTLHIEDGFRTVYAAMTVAMDEGIGGVVAALEAVGLRQNTLLFFVNDNGGRIGSDNRPLRGHKGQLYEGGVRVPFLVSWPGHLPQGEAYDEPVSEKTCRRISQTSSASYSDSTRCGTLNWWPLCGPTLTPKTSSRSTAASPMRASGPCLRIRTGDAPARCPAPQSSVRIFRLRNQMELPWSWRTMWPRRARPYWRCLANLLFSSLARQSGL